MSENIVPLSVVVIARNEAENIARCLNSVNWADERVVIDDHSTDGTSQIAAELGARVVTHRFESFAHQRNWGLEHAELRNDWVLMLDADEVSTPDFALAVNRALSSASEETAAFRLCRKTMFLGRWLKRSDGFPVWIMRLVHRSRARFEDSGHGEVPVPEVQGTMGTIPVPFIHFPFSKGLTDWVQRHVRYAEREARQELDQVCTSGQGSLFSFHAEQRRSALRSWSRRMPARPILRFCYQYLIKGGILEGQAGLVFSFLMAVYEGLILVKRIELARRDRGESI